VNREGVPAVVCLLAKHSLTDSALIQAGQGTPKHTETIIDAIQKEALDQQHSCDMLICQHYQTLLRCLYTATMASMQWLVREL
jgi:hypothetical protein